MIAAGIESLLIFLVFIVLSALSTWMQKRQQAEDDTADRLPGEPGRPQRPASPPSGQPGPRRPTPSPLQDWEGELRRLLQGERPPSPQAPPPPAPPPLAVPPVRPRPAGFPQVGSSELGGERDERVTRLEDSQQAFRKAQKLQAEAAKQLRAAQAKTALHRRPYALAEIPSGESDIRAARALLSNPWSARQAIIASVVLGPPKAFE